MEGEESDSGHPRNASLELRFLATAHGETLLKGDSDMSHTTALMTILIGMAVALGLTTPAQAETAADGLDAVAAPILIQGRLLSFRFASDEADVDLLPGSNPVPGMQVSFSNTAPTAVLIQFCAEVVDDGTVGAFLRLQAQVDDVDAEPDDFLVTHSENLVGVPMRSATCFTWAFPGVAPGDHDVSILASPNNGTFEIDERTLTVQYFR